jgi:hypothetical protein
MKEFAFYSTGLKVNWALAHCFASPVPPCFVKQLFFESQ